MNRKRDPAGRLLCPRVVIRADCTGTGQIAQANRSDHADNGLQARLLGNLDWLTQVGWLVHATTNRVGTWPEPVRKLLIYDDHWQALRRILWSEIAATH